MLKITIKCTFFEKKCKKIWSCQKKAVPLHSLLKRAVFLTHKRSPKPRSESSLSKSESGGTSRPSIKHRGIDHSDLVAEREGAVVQLVRIPACHAVGREFESRPHRKKRNFSSERLRFFSCDGLTRTLMGSPQNLFCGERRERDNYTSYAVTQSLIAASDDESRPHRKARKIAGFVIVTHYNRPKICSNCHLIRNTRRISFCSSVIR